LQKEYLRIVKLLDKEFEFLRSNFKPLKPSHFKLLRRSFSYEEIQSTLISLNSDPIQTDRKSLFLYVKDTLKKEVIPSSTSNEPIIEKDYNSIAFEQLNEIIVKEFPRVASIPQQLSIATFTSIFNKYDWEDIVRKLEDLNDWEVVSKQKSLSKILQTFLTNDKTIHPIDEGKVNSFIKEQKRLERMRESDLEKQKKEDEFQRYFNSVKDIEAWSKLDYVPKLEDRESFVREYLRFIEEFESEEYPKFSHLSQFTLEQAIKYKDEHQDFQWLSFMLDQFHKSTSLEKHTSAYEFLLEQTILEYPEGWEDEED